MTRLQRAARILALTLSSWFVFSSASADQSQASTAIYVARRGWHIDVGFASDEIAAPLHAILGNFHGVSYLFFGFGDRQYLMAKHQSMPAMRAALWPGKGLILATGLGATPAEAFGGPNIIKLRVSAEQSLAAQDFIWRSLRDAYSPNSDQVPIVARGPYEGSVYFSARARYSAFYTCNTWGAEVLKKSGLPVRTGGVLFAGQLWRQVRKLAAAE
ncbi:MAG TPA: DUF2459 domain-containing protein [Steroidobacteraceae bacterium]